MLRSFASIRVDNERFYIGDRVLFHQAYRKAGIENGFRATVVAVNPVLRQITVRLDDAPSVDAKARDSRMYGPHFTDEILAQIGNRFIGRLECPEAAEWASRVIGDQEVNQYTTSHSTSSGQSGTSNSTTNSQQIVTRRAALPSEFLSIPPCGLENGLSGYFVVRSVGCYFAAFSGQEIFAEQLIPAAPDVPEFIPRPVETQYLKPWTQEQAAVFGVPISKRDRAKKRPRSKPAPDLNAIQDLEDL